MARDTRSVDRNLSLSGYWPSLASASARIRRRPADEADGRGSEPVRPQAAPRPFPSGGDPPPSSRRGLRP
jgi:hypothetical protein